MLDRLKQTLQNLLDEIECRYHMVRIWFKNKLKRKPKGTEASVVTTQPQPGQSGYTFFSFKHRVPPVKDIEISAPRPAANAQHLTRPSTAHLPPPFNTPAPILPPELQHLYRIPTFKRPLTVQERIAATCRPAANSAVYTPAQRLVP